MTVAGLFAVGVLVGGGAARADVEAPVLLRATDAVPFVKEGVVARIDHRHAVTEHRQIVRNAVPGQSEGNYTLDAGPGAVVTKFSYWNGDEEIRGELLERADATAIYDAVTRAKRDPGLLDELAPGKFRYRIFPFSAGESKRVEIRWETWLPANGRAVEYTTPIARPNTTVTVDVEGASAAPMRSDTHEIDVEPLPRPGGEGTAYRVRAKAPRGGSSPTQFVLHYELAGTTPASFVHAEPGREVFVTLDFPALEPTGPRLPRDVTFVIDRSGSESPETLARSRLAVREAIGKLKSRDRVNVIAFDETVTSLYPAPKDVTADVVRESREFVSKIRDGAGTDLGGALRATLESQAGGAERDRLAILMTDGVADGPSAVEALESGRRDVRIVALAIGETIDEKLLGKLTSLRGGFVDTSKTRDVTERLLRLYERTAQPALQNVRLDLNGAAGVNLAMPVPTTLPPGERLHVALRCRPHGVLQARLSGDFGNASSRVTSAVDVDTKKAQYRPWVATDWAKARIDSLLPTGRDEALEVALTYELSSPMTAFFAIPASEAVRVKGQIADARRRKRWMTEDGRESAYAQNGGGGGAGGAPDSFQEVVVVGSSAKYSAEPSPPSAMASPSVERVHGRGCAGCALIPERSADTSALLASAVALALVIERRRKKQRNVSERARSSGGAT